MFRDKAKGVTNNSKTKSKRFKISIAIGYRYGIINLTNKKEVINYEKSFIK